MTTEDAGAPLIRAVLEIPLSFARQAAMDRITEQDQQFPPCASVNPSAPDGPLDGIKLVDVEWEGKKAMMFTIDLQVRGELADAAGNRPPGECLVFKNPDWVYA